MSLQNIIFHYIGLHLQSGGFDLEQKAEVNNQQKAILIGL